MIEKLVAIKDRFEEVGQLLVQPDAMSDMKVYSKLNKEYKDLEKIVLVYDDYQNVKNNIASAKEVLQTEKDEEFRDMAKMELDELVPREEVLEAEIKVLLIPKDPDDQKNVIMAMKPLFLPETSIECTSVLLKAKDGKRN